VPDSAAHVATVFAEIAARLGGELEIVGMDVWGIRDEMPFSAETRWNREGQLQCTALTVTPLLPISSRFHGRWGPDGPTDALADGLAPLLDDAIGVAVGAYRFELYLPPAPENADAIVERLEALIAVGRRLSMRDGIYR
jgi:hypothetical protein